MRTKYVVITLIATLFFACQKNPDGGILSPASCTLEKVVYFDTDGTTPVDTLELVYSGSQVTRADYSTIAITLEYTNGKVSRRNVMAQGTTAIIYYDLFTYNTDGSLSKVESYFNALATPFVYYTYDYTYTGGKVTSILEKQDTSAAGAQPIVPVYSYAFTYTGNNITKVDEQDLINNVPSDSYTYQYDTKPNYFNKIPNSFYYELEFLDYFSPNLPLFLSENNVTGIDVQPDHTILGYTEENGNIKTLLVDGSKVANYMYKCQ
jgi:hypothetical protein